MEIWKPTIAAVNGPCIGYGLTAVLACDFVLASDRATFAYPEVRIGVPTIVGALRLPDRVAWPDALELLLTGDTISSERARETGLAWKVIPHDDLMTEARTLADRLCAGAPLAVRATNEMARRGRHHALDRGGTDGRDHAPSRLQHRRRRPRAWPPGRNAARRTGKPVSSRRPTPARPARPGGWHGGKEWRRSRRQAAPVTPAGRAEHLSARQPGRPTRGRPGCQRRLALSVGELVLNQQGHVA